MGFLVESDEFRSTNQAQEATPTATAAGNPRYEPHESPPLKSTLGLGLQFSILASATLLVTPVVVAKESGRDESYLIWMVFASLLVVGVSTLIQVRRLGPLGGGAVLPMFTAAFAIPFCITAVVDGGPTTLTTLIIASAIFQLVISKWLFVLRRVVTPIVSGTVIMILSITLASVVFGLIDDAAQEEPAAALSSTLVTLAIVVALTLRGTAFMRLWAPVVGIAAGCATAAAMGIYDTDLVTKAAWVGIPSEWPGLGLDFGVDFWVLAPSFLFLGVIISIQVNGESISIQRVSSREPRAIDFRRVQGTLAGTGVGNLLSGIAGGVPLVINPGAVPFTQTTGMASRRIGYVIGVVFIIMAFLPKASGLLSTIPGPVMAGYLMLVVGTLFVDGARTVIQNEQNRSRLIVAGISFWIGASFQFTLFNLPDLGAVVGALLKSAVTTGGVSAVLMIIFLELTSHRRMRFQSKLHIDSLPELTQFIHRFSDSRHWNDAMKDRLSAVAEETLLTLAPIDFEAELEDLEEENEGDGRQLVVVASSDGSIAELEFIGGGSGENMEDQIRQMQDHEEETPIDTEISLRLLRRYASSVRHQQFHGTDIITVRVGPQGTR